MNCGSNFKFFYILDILKLTFIKIEQILNSTISSGKEISRMTSSLVLTHETLNKLQLRKQIRNARFSYNVNISIHYVIPIQIYFFLPLLYLRLIYLLLIINNLLLNQLVTLN